MRQSIGRSNRHCSGERGFALVLVIWGLGLISLIAMTVIIAGRNRILAAANLIENAKAEALAEAGVNLRRLELRAAFSGGSPNTLPFARTASLCCAPCRRGRWLRWRSKTKAARPISITRRRSSCPRSCAASARGPRKQIALPRRSPSSPVPPPMSCLMTSRSAPMRRTDAPMDRRRARSRPCWNSTRSSACGSDLLRAVLPYVTVHSRNARRRSARCRAGAARGARGL